MYFAKHEEVKSIHISSWPKSILVDKKAETAGELVVYAVTKARQAKSEQKLSLKTPLKNLVIEGKISNEDFELIKEDILGATKTEKITYEQLKEDSKIDFEVKIEL